MKKRINREAKYFYLFISPWLVGFLLFILYPVLSSLYYSFTDYDAITSPVWIGLDNYQELFEDELFWLSIEATVKYTLMSVPVHLLLSLGFALLLNQKVPFRNLFRTSMYFPSMISGVAISIMWLWVLNPQIGVLNYLLSLFGIKGPLWLLDENWALPALVIMSLWSVGGGMVIFLAALQGVPAILYEAATLDGASRFRKLWNITLPLISPVLLFQLIMNIIQSFQVFTQAYVMTKGGPAYSTMFYVYHLYKTAFYNFRMGYASAMAWILLIAILILTFIILKTSSRFVYYEGGERA